MLDLLSLKLFVACVEVGSLSRVSKQHHIALAALSRRITLLEEQYGIQLLERTGRGVKPTNAGLTLYKRSHEIFEKIHITQVDLKDYLDGKKGEVSIIVSTSAINYQLPKQLRNFSFAHPDIRLEIDEAFTSEIIDSIRNHTHEIGIMLKSDLVDDLETIFYHEDELVIVTDQSIKFNQEQISFEQISSFEFILMDGSAAISKVLSQAAAKLDTALRIRVRVSSFETACRMIEAGFGIGIVPLKVAEQCKKTMNLKYYKLSEQWSKREFQICYLKNRKLSSVASKLLYYLQQNE